jgi:hypothetical protein
MISITNFDRHLSHSAKTRAESAIRKKKERSKPVTKMSQKNVTSVTGRSQQSVTTVTENQDKNVTIEKRREEKTNTESVTRAGEDQRQLGDDLTFLHPSSEPFNRFWDALPPGMKSGRQACVKAFPEAIRAIIERHGMSDTGAENYLVDRTRHFAKMPRGQNPEFRWSPLTFLRDGHYDDSDESWQSAPRAAGSGASGNGKSAEQIRQQSSLSVLAAFANLDAR